MLLLLLLLLRRCLCTRLRLLVRVCGVHHRPRSPHRVRPHHRNLPLRPTTTTLRPSTTTTSSTCTPTQQPARSTRGVGRRRVAPTTTATAAAGWARHEQQRNEDH